MNNQTNISYIWVTTHKEGFHFWKQAPKAVKFLKHPHRHVFSFKIYLSIKHNDREIEFFMFKKDVKFAINNIWVKYDLYSDKKCKGLSCEMISDEICKIIKKKYVGREIIIEVSEDGENGSRKEYI